MARGYTARESGQDAFKGVVGGLSADRQAEISKDIFFDQASARKAAQAGYAGPKSKNAYSWFTPSTDAEVTKLSEKWASDKAGLLGKVWDASEGKVPVSFIQYPDKQTFIDRHVRFLGDYHKASFAHPISKALGTSFAIDKLNPYERARASDGKPSLKDAVEDWNKMLDKSEVEIRSEALNYLKSKI